MAVAVSLNAPSRLGRAIEAFHAGRELLRDVASEYSDMAFCFGRAIVSTESTLPSELPSDRTKAGNTVRSGAQFIESCIRMGAGNLVPTPPP
jgi:hypothetical protein